MSYTLGSVKTMYHDDQGLSNAVYIHVCKAITRHIVMTRRDMPVKLETSRDMLEGFLM